MNKVLRLLTLSDLFILSSFGLIQPIFAVFMLQQIAGTTITTIGIAVSIQLFTKALLQIVVGKWTDAEKGNCRELYTLIAGSLIVSLTPIGYLLSSNVLHIFLVQFALGVGEALSFPSWRVIFNRYINQDRAGYEYGVYDTVVSLGTAGAATIGAHLAEVYSFAYLFLFITIMSLIGTTFLVFIFQQEFACRINFKK